MRYLVLITAVVAWTVVGFMVGKQVGIAEGRSMALKEAYKTNPVSEELERTCFTLWVGEQAKKAWKKENEK